MVDAASGKRFSLAEVAAVGIFRWSVRDIRMLPNFSESIPKTGRQRLVPFRARREVRIPRENYGPLFTDEFVDDEFRARSFIFPVVIEMGARESEFLSGNPVFDFDPFNSPRVGVREVYRSRRDARRSCTSR